MESPGQHYPLPHRTREMVNWWNTSTIEKARAASTEGASNIIRIRRTTPRLRSTRLTVSMESPQAQWPAVSIFLGVSSTPVHRWTRPVSNTMLGNSPGLARNPFWIRYSNAACLDRADQIRPRNRTQNNSIECEGSSVSEWVSEWEAQSFICDPKWLSASYETRVKEPLIGLRWNRWLSSSKCRHVQPEYQWFRSRDHMPLCLRWIFLSVQAYYRARS